MDNLLDVGNKRAKFQAKRAVKVEAQEVQNSRQKPRVFLEDEYFFEGLSSAEQGESPIIYNEMLIGKKLPAEHSNYVNDVEDNVFKDLGEPTENGRQGNSGESLVRRKIIQYRETARDSEMEDILSDIVNESIIAEDGNVGVKIDIKQDDKLTQTINSKVIKRFYTEFNNVIYDLDFDTDGAEIFKRWYIDGRLYIWNKRSNGRITGYEIIDPLTLSLEEKENPSTKQSEYYYRYERNLDVTPLDSSQNNFMSYFAKTTDEDDVIYIPFEDMSVIYSGEYDYLMKIYISHIERSLKILNSMNNLEDAMVLHQFIRAVPRRLFKIYTGKMNHTQRVKYINDLMTKHRENINLQYDTTTGAIGGDSKTKYLSLFDDYWLPIGDNDKSEITNIDGQGNTEWETITDKLSYYRRKLYRANRTPFSRFDAQANDQSEYKIGVEQMLRNERKFQKFISGLRRRFSEMFLILLEKRVVESTLVNETEWQIIRKRINIIWEDDNYFQNLKKQELIKKQADAIAAVDQYVGKYYTKDFVFKEILGLTDDEMAKVKKQLKFEQAEEQGVLPPEEQSPEAPSSVDFGARSSGGGGGAPSGDMSSSEEPTPEAEGAPVSEIPAEDLEGPPASEVAITGA